MVISYTSNVSTSESSLQINKNEKDLHEILGRHITKSISTTHYECANPTYDCGSGCLYLRDIPKSLGEIREGVAAQRIEDMVTEVFNDSSITKSSIKGEYNCDLHCLEFLGTSLGNVTLAISISDQDKDSQYYKISLDTILS